MKAMILAAGYGTRLGSLVDKKPKCLVEVAGVPILLRLIQNLQKHGVNHFIVNAHYLADKIEEFIINSSLSNKVKVVIEDQILGTGGGVLNAEQYFSKEEDFLIHNADIYCEMDYSALFNFHGKNKGLATLVSRKKTTKDCLYFSKNNEFLGWSGVKSSQDKLAYSDVQEKTFCGIHVVSTDFFKFLKEYNGNFSILKPYLKAIASKEKIFEYDLGNTYWKDMGTPQALEELNSYLS